MQYADCLLAKTKRWFYGIIFIHRAAAGADQVAAVVEEGYHEALGKRNLRS